MSDIDPEVRDRAMEFNDGCDDEEEFQDSIIRAKWVMDGAKTLSECAAQLRAYADWLEECEAEGHQLIDPVNDDYGFVRPMFPDQVQESS